MKNIIKPSSKQEDAMELVNLSTFLDTQPHRVLVLEDDLELSTVIERVLRSIDSTISLDWATSAEGAIAQLERMLMDESQPAYDLIVADIFLDGKSTGIDFWRTCQDLFPDTPVLITSALSLERFFATVGRHCISPPYLQKPFTVVECKQVFETMLRYSSRL
jgi:CheY-like chemotaxis protein